MNVPSAVPVDPPRIAPLPPNEWPPQMRAALAALQPADARHPFPPRDPSRPKGLNVLGTLAQHPALTQAYHTLTGHVLFGTSLSLRQRELVVLRVAAVRDSVYEWRQHEVLAADVGLDPDEVARIAAGPDAPGWAPLDAAFLRAVDELIADALISDATWAVLADELEVEQLMDLIFTVGTYDVLAMLFRTAGVPLDDDLRPTGDGGGAG
jgi:alkylhydroperoxidase family enzyme